MVTQAFKKRGEFSQSAGFYCYISIFDNLQSMLRNSGHRLLNAFTVAGLAQKCDWLLV